MNDLKKLHGEVIALRLQVASVEARRASLKLAKARRAAARIAPQKTDAEPEENDGKTCATIA